MFLFLSPQNNTRLSPLHKIVMLPEAYFFKSVNSLNKTYFWKDYWKSYFQQKFFFRSVVIYVFKLKVIEVTMYCVKTLSNACMFHRLCYHGFALLALLYLLMWIPIIIMKLLNYVLDRYTSILYIHPFFWYYRPISL